MVFFHKNYTLIHKLPLFVFSEIFAIAIGEGFLQSDDPSIKDSYKNIVSPVLWHYASL